MNHRNSAKTMLGGLGLLSVLIAVGLGAWIVKLQMSGPQKSAGSSPAGAVAGENVRPLDALNQAKDLASKMNERAQKLSTTSAPQELSK